MAGERIARAVARVALNSIALVAVLGIVIVTLRAREPVSVVVTVAALMVPVFVAVEVAAAFAKVEPPGRKDGRVHGALAALIAAPFLVAVTVHQWREPDRADVAAQVGPDSWTMPRSEAALQRLRERFNG